MGTKYLPDEMRYLAGSRQSQPVGWVEHRTQSDMGRADNPRDGDGTGHALMFGRYLGQVSARIQRAWIRPRSPVEGGSFACRVQIAQSMSGAVQEVTLQQCNGDLRWQASLVQAIQSASPLPAPPDPSVFSNLLSLELDSDEFHAGSRDDGFEPAPLLRTPVLADHLAVQH